METIIIAAVVLLAALFIAKRFRNYIKSANYSGPGCCGSCGCRTSKEDEEKIVNIKKAE